MTEKQYLEEKDLRHIELKDLDIKFSKLSMDVTKKNIAIIEEKMRTQELQRKMLTADLRAKSEDIKNKEDVYRILIKEIRQRYNIGEEQKFGFDPLSGEIILD